MRIPCPYCGERSNDEFVVKGDADAFLSRPARRRQLPSTTISTFAPTTPANIMNSGITRAGAAMLRIPATTPLTITGIVESIDATALNLRHKSGQLVSIAITPRTAIVRHDSPAQIADITAGMRIVVVYRFVDGAPTADEVRLFRPPLKAATRRPLLLS